MAQELTGVVRVGVLPVRQIAEHRCVGFAVQACKYVTAEADSLYSISRTFHASNNWRRLLNLNSHLGIYDPNVLIPVGQVVLRCACCASLSRSPSAQSRPMMTMWWLRLQPYSTLNPVSACDERVVMTTRCRGRAWICSVRRCVGWWGRAPPGGLGVGHTHRTRCSNRHARTHRL